MAKTTEEMIVVKGSLPSDSLRSLPKNLPRLEPCLDSLLDRYHQCRISSRAQRARESGGLGEKAHDCLLFVRPKSIVKIVQDADG